MIPWPWLLVAAWLGLQIPVAVLIGRQLRHGSRDMALADATREPRGGQRARTGAPASAPPMTSLPPPATVTDIIAAPCAVIWQCGCRPCPPHAAGQLARDRAGRIRAQWNTEWNERLQ